MSNYLKLAHSQLKIDDLDPESGQSLLQRRLEWIFGFPFLSTSMIDGEHVKIGLDALDHNIRGDVYQYKSMIAYD